MEVVVTDDGSPRSSRPIVEAFAREVDFPVRFTTHPHTGFRLARCRNEGIAVSTSPYLLISDGDCIFPPDHIAWHLAYREWGKVVVGDCLRLDPQTSQHVTENTIRGGLYAAWASRCERRRIARKVFKGFWARFLPLTMYPRLTGCNIGVWRSDLERINGFDENFVGWGLEDRDLQLRLSRLGLRFKSIVGRTTPYHLWHEPVPTFARNNEGTRNLEYYRRKSVPTRCLAGLQERIAESGEDLRDDRVLMPGRSGGVAEPVLLRFPADVPGGTLRKAG